MTVIDDPLTAGIPTASHPFHVMVKPRGAICNLDCGYCYYLAKEELYPGSSFRMSDALLEEFTRQYIVAQPDGAEVIFSWQGGEPLLMGLDFFRRAVELQGRYRRPGQQILNSVQTNGTLLDDGWCRFLREHDFLVGLSLDGPRALHDAYRVDKGGSPTWERVMDGLALLQRHRVDFNILACVHAANEGYPLATYRFLRDEARAKFIQFIPIVERGGDAIGIDPLQPHAGARSVSPRGYGAFLSAIFDEWLVHDVGRVFVQAFDAALAAWTGNPPGLCVFEETCGRALALEHNGDLYACDHFVEPAHRVGNIAQAPLVNLVESEPRGRFGLDKRARLPKMCLDCEVRFVCNGECPRNRIVTTPDGEPGLNYLCEGYRAFFAHIDPPMRAMAELLSQHRAPAEMVERFAHAQRNAPCPCGSGRKFKQCHGRRPSGP